MNTDQLLKRIEILDRIGNDGILSNYRDMPETDLRSTYQWVADLPSHRWEHLILWLDSNDYNHRMVALRVLLSEKSLRRILRNMEVGS
jgi:hypothetical protein